MAGTIGTLKEQKEREHWDFLRKVANGIYELVRNPKIMTRFREQVKIFCEKNEEHQREVEQLKADSLADSKLQVAINNLEKKTWGKTWDEMTDEERKRVNYEDLFGTLPEGYENCVWDEGYCIDPWTVNLLVYLSPPTDWGREIDCRFWGYQAAAASDDDKIISCYALLTAIHDTRISEKPIYTNKVYNGSWRLVDKWIKQLYQGCLNISYPWEFDSFDGGEDVRDWITRALNDVKADLASLDKVKKKAEAKIEIRQKIMPKEYIELAEQIAANLDDWANPKGETGLRYEYVGHLKPISIALEGFDELIGWIHSNRPEKGELVQSAYDELISKANIDDILLEGFYEGDEVLSEEYAIRLAKLLREIINVTNDNSDHKQSDKTQESQAGRADLASTEQNPQKRQDKQVITHNGFMNLEQLCKQFNVSDKNKQAFRKRLERFRAKNTFGDDAFIESQNKGARQAKYLYNVKMVASIAEEVRRRTASFKRPSKKKTK